MTDQSQRPKVYFRADGNSQMGLGHIYRSLALADMLRGEFDCFFMVRQPLESLQPKIQEIATLIALPEPTNNSQEAEYIVSNYLTGNEIVVLDGYHFVTDYQKIIKSKGSKLVCIDDIYAYHFVADVVVNHAGGIEPSRYKKEFYSQTYLGLEYLLLRSNFLEIAQQSYAKTDEGNIFICMGGADTHNDTLKVLQKIEDKKETSSIKCFVIVGQAYLHKDALISFVQKSKLNIEILSNLSGEQMLQYMQLCSIAVCPPSSVCFEYLCTKGVLHLLQTADNQKDVKKYLMGQKLAFDFELEYPVTDRNALINTPLLQSTVVDGKSNLRLLSIFQRLHQELNLRIEVASEKHLELYFDWANDPTTRQNAFNPNPIPFETHKEWFSKKIKSKDALLLCFYNGSNPIGQVRLDKITTNSVQIDYSVAPQLKSLGYGVSILKLAILYAYKEGFCTGFYGEVKKSNIPSVKVFQKLSFQENYDDEKELYSYTLSL